MRDTSSSIGPSILIVVLLTLLLKWFAAGAWGLLADEAYYWVWSHHLAWGYYDQPPFIAWMVRLGRFMGEHPLGIRAPALICGIVLSVGALPAAEDQGFWLLWSVAIPPLAWLTLFSTPDAPLLAAWAVSVGAATLGGPWGWIVAGLAGGVAGLSKYTGLLVVPLLVLGAGPKEWRTPWPWVALGLSAVLLLPNLVWNAGHDWVSFRFQLAEGLLDDNSPGLWGPVIQTLDQVGVITPLAWLAGISWAVLRSPDVWASFNDRAALEDDRRLRLAWFTAAPLLVLFPLAALGGPPEAHWPAPAWIGIGLGLSAETGRFRRLAEVGAWLALILGLLWLHGFFPLVRFPTDPGTRLTEGPILGRWVASWAEPSAAAAGAAPTPVLTERYQEASFVHYYTGNPALKLPGCGRLDQYDLWFAEGDLPEEALFLRPWEGDPPPCVSERYDVSGGPGRLRGRDLHGRFTGVWQIEEIRAR